MEVPAWLPGMSCGWDPGLNEQEASGLALALLPLGSALCCSVLCSVELAPMVRGWWEVFMETHSAVVKNLGLESGRLECESFLCHLASDSGKVT